MRWRVCYTDGSDFTHLDGEPADAPGSNVAAVAQEDAAIGLAVHHGKDFYVFDAAFGGWVEMDYFGLAQHLATPGCKVVKLGGLMPTADYRALLTALRHDPRLPKKSARYRWERV